MDKCKCCGQVINERYTYCRSCFYRLGSPKGLVVNKQHKCRKCGKSITGKYNYCPDCAIKIGYMKREDYVKPLGY